MLQRPSPAWLVAPSYALPLLLLLPALPAWRVGALRPERRWPGEHPPPPPPAACFKLDSAAFPLQVEELMRRADGSKKAYFHLLSSMGIGETLALAPPPGQGGLPNACLARPGSRKFHVIFAGDCMVRQTFEAFLRNQGSTGGGEGQRRLPSSLRAILAGESSSRGWPPMSSASEIVAERSAAPNATYVAWVGATPADVVLEAVGRLIQQLGLEPREDTVILWMGNAIHPVVYGWLKEWTDLKQREPTLTAFWEVLHSKFPGVQVIWDAPTFVDMVIMGATPAKKETPRFRESNATARLLELQNVDEQAARKHHIPLSPRHRVSKLYRGLQCDGLHADPHESTGARAWDCMGFKAYEDLILQGALHAACKGSDIPLCLER